MKLAETFVITGPHSSRVVKCAYDIEHGFVLEVHIRNAPERVSPFNYHDMMAKIAAYGGE